MPRSLTSDSTSVVTFSILIDGQEIPTSYGVISILVHREMNKIPYAVIKLMDGGVGEEMSFDIGNSSHLCARSKGRHSGGVRFKPK